jgi:hypothetical protein
MSSILDEFIADARAVDLETVAGLCGVAVKGRADEKKGPCPRCGGKDRFSINFRKGVWNCGHLGGAGGDGLALVAHCHDFDLKRRAGLMEACAVILGRPVPEGGERESEDERTARAARLAAIAAERSAERASRAAEAEAWRLKAIEKGRAFWFRAVDARVSDVADYLRLRTGFAMPDGVFENLRLSPRHGYWHGEDERGHRLELHNGPAMIAPFVTPDGKVVGCHETWLDLSAEPKYRPALFALTAEGLRQKSLRACGGAGERPNVADGRLALPPSADVEAGIYERLPTKKMQGAVKGAMIPLLGDLAALRWMGGEGIENVLAVAGAEGFRADTFYFAAGSLGNLAGPADASSGIAHPTIRKADKNGVLRPVRVQGCVPKPGSEADCVAIADHVSEIVLVCDGDSEPVMTAAAVARTIARHRRDGRVIADWWPPRGRDWAGAILAGLTIMGRAA